MEPTLLLSIPTLGAVVDVFKGAIYVVFVLIALIMTVVILLQEGQGGGLGGAFGGAAADTFGVKAGTVNKFTSYLATGFLGLALLYAGLTARSGAPASIELAPPSVPAGGALEGGPGEAVHDTDQPAEGQPAEGQPTKGQPAEGSGETPPAPPPGGGTPPDGGSGGNGDG